jgi:hypothetical protein
VQDCGGRRRHRGPGVENIVASVLPATSAGGIVVMHEAGGDRSQTVAALIVGVLVLAVACGEALPATTGAAPTASSAPVAAPAIGGNVAVEVTFYGGLDNDPPASTEIAYPNGRHPAAGGTGTYADPVTVASDPRALPPGTLLYEPRLRIYLVMEDDCAECIIQWDHGRVGHIDIWTGTAGAGLQACEQALTPDDPVTIEVNPPPGRPVDPRPLYTPGGGCRVASPSIGVPS